MPGQLQQHPLLGIRLGSLAGGDAKERRLEQVDTANQPCCPRVALAGLVTIGMVEESGRPTLRIDLGDRIRPGGEQSPEGLQILRSRESAGRSDDRDRSVTHTAKA